MLLVGDFLNSVINNMLADTNYLKANTAGSSDLVIRPIVQPFTPVSSLALGDLVYADGTQFDTPVVSLGDDDQNFVRNPGGDPGVDLVEPVGGFTFITPEPLADSFSVYGFALIKQDAGEDEELMAVAIIAARFFSAPLLAIQFSSLLGYLSGGQLGQNGDVITDAPLTPSE